MRRGLHATVYKHASVQLGVADEESGVVEEIARLRPYKEGRPNRIGLDFRFGITVRGVEAAKEARHDLELWVRVCDGDNVRGLVCAFKVSLDFDNEPS